MARPGVTYTEVATAADRLVSEGQSPTIDRIREAVGGGSKSTLAPLLKRWRATQEGDGEGRAVGLPTALVEAVKALYEQVEQGADHRIAVAQQDFTAAHEKLQQALAAADKQIAELTGRRDEVTQLLEAVEAQNQQLQQALAEAEKGAVKREAQLSTATIRIDELKAALAEARQENRDIRGHFEHYQQRIAEDRERERANTRALTQQLEGQLAQVTRELTAAEEALADVRSARIQDQEQLMELREAVQGLQHEVALKKQGIENLTQRYQTATEENQALARQNEVLQQTVNTLTAEQAAANQEAAGSKQALEKAEAARLEAMDRICLLEEENRHLIEEKAMVQGQLLQLQGSLVQR